MTRVSGSSRVGAQTVIEDSLPERPTLPLGGRLVRYRSTSCPGVRPDRPNLRSTRGRTGPWTPFKEVERHGSRGRYFVSTVIVPTPP